jgi:peptide deformylase
MALRTILTQHDKALRGRSRPVTNFGQRTAQLLDDMRETLIHAQGAGLAAPQVGIKRRAALVAVEGEFVEMLNPEILERSQEQSGLYEGCLSFPGLRGYLLRPRSVIVRAQDRFGSWFELECKDIAARAVCHEIDHLDGVLFADLVEELITDEELDEMIMALYSQEEDDDSPPGTDADQDGEGSAGDP